MCRLACKITKLTLFSQAMSRFWVGLTQDFEL